MPNVSTLTVRLSANSSKLVAEFNKAQKRSKTFAQRVGASLRIAGRAFAGLATAAGFGLIALARAGTTAADTLAKTADKLGLAADELAGLRFAAQQTGVGIKTLDLGLQRMVRRVAEASVGTGEAQKALKELGLDAKELARQSPDEQFRRVAEAMQNVGSQSDRVRLGFKLFDSEAVGLVNTLAGGRAGLDAFGEEAERLGLALNSIQLDNIQDAADAQGRLASAFSGLGRQVAAVFAPALEAANNAAADLVSTITRSIPQLAAYASAVFGISRAVDDLTLSEARLEFAAVGAELANAKNRLVEFQIAATKVNQFSVYGDTGTFEGLKIQGENVQRLVLRWQELERSLKGVDRESREAAAGVAVVTEAIDTSKESTKELLREIKAFLKAQDEISSTGQSIFQQTRTPIENYIQKIGEARTALEAGLLPGGIETFNRYRAALLDGVIDPIGEIAPTAKNAFGLTDQYAIQAARNIQDAFAQFFLNFDKGTKQMVASFLDAIATMLANQAAAKLLGFLGAKFNPVTATAAASAGATAGAASGTFLKSSPSIIVQQSYNVAAGLTAAELNNALPVLLEQNKIDTIQTIQGLQLKRQF